MIVRIQLSKGAAGLLEQVRTSNVPLQVPDNDPCAQELINKTLVIGKKSEDINGVLEIGLVDHFGGYIKY